MATAGRRPRSDILRHRRLDSPQGAPMRFTPVPLVIALLAFAAPLAAAAAPPPLLPEAAVRALAGELSGTAAKRTVQALTLQHRMRGSRGFHAAAELVASEARRFGLAEVQVLSFPADGEVFYGTQRSRPAWDADFAELWEQRPAGAGSTLADTFADALRIASWEARPVTLAEDSAAGEVAAPLVDVGPGSAEGDYRGKEVRGRLVLAAAQADA